MHPLNQIIASEFPSPVPADEVFDLYAPNSQLPLSIMLSYDQDIHLFPLLDFEEDQEKPFQWLCFDRKSHPVACGLLDLLTVAILHDTTNKSILTPSEVSEVLSCLLSCVNSLDFPSVNPGNYQIVHDDNGGDRSQTLEVQSDLDKVSVRVNCFDGLRFRTFFGGGKWHQVRNALSILCLAIQKELV